MFSPSPLLFPSFSINSGRLIITCDSSFPPLMSYSSTRVSMMRCPVCLWWAFLHSRLCFTTVNTFSMQLPLSPVVTKAGTHSTCSLVKTPPVDLRTATHWVGLLLSSFGSSSFKAVSYSNFLSSVRKWVIIMMWLTRFWEFSVVLEKCTTGTRYQLQQTFQLPLHIQHGGQCSSCTLRRLHSTMQEIHLCAKSTLLHAVPHR